MDPVAEEEVPRSWNAARGLSSTSRLLAGLLDPIWSKKARKDYSTQLCHGVL